MAKLTRAQRDAIIEMLANGEDLPLDYKHILFPPERQEYELVYAGKDREEDMIAETMAVPLQPIRYFGSNAQDWHNMLIFGDNLQSLKSLLKLKEEGKLRNKDGTSGARMVYIDPPFATKHDFQGNRQEKAYQDKIAGAAFIESLRKRLVLLKGLLSNDGTIYVHLDTRKGHYIKVVLDEIFGENNFQNEIIWKRSAAHSDSGTFANIHDSIFMYSKSADFFFKTQYQPYDDDYIDERYKHTDPDRRRFMDDNLTATGLKGGGYEYEWKGVTKLWRCPPKTMVKHDRENKIYYTKKGVARIKRYLDEMPGLMMQARISG